MASDSLDIAFLLPLGMVNAFTNRHYLGVAYIQAHLAKHGFKSVQIIPAFGCTLENYIAQLIAANAKIIGLTCYDANFSLIKTIATLIKQKNPKLIIIAGGPTATFSDELMLRNISGIDLCVRFEGEETTLDIISLLSENNEIKELDGIKGITFRQGNSIVRTEDRELFGFHNNKENSLDQLPSPYIEGILNGTEGAGLLSSRGCHHRCTYCNFSAMSKHTIRYHSVDRVIDELIYIQNAMETNSISRIVNFLDDAFTINIKRAKSICERIIDEGIKLELSCLCRADKIDEEFIELFSQAGFSELIFGVESAVPRILRNIRKIPQLQFENSNDFSLEQNFLLKLREDINLAKKYKMKTIVSIILGLPGETFPDGLKTIEFVRDLEVDEYAHNYLTPYPGTELFETAKNFGIKISPSSKNFILPYRAEYSYPVHEIPFGKNSSVELCRKMAIEAILRTFIGNRDTNIGKEDGIIKTIIERSKAGNFFEPFNWLAKHIAVGSEILILGKQNETIDDYDMMRETCHNSGLPIRRFYYLRNCSTQNNEITYDLINKPVHGKLWSWNPQFQLINLSRCSEPKIVNKIEENQLNFVYCLNDKKDAYFLASIADELKQIQRDSTDFWMDGVFLDSCRWNKDLCPALEMRRVFINKSGEVLPCMTGQSLGTLADDIKFLRRNAIEIYHKICEKRRCDVCSVESLCSKCLFPYPLDQEEFCELQRSKLGVSRIIMRSNLANIIALKK